MRLDDLNIEDIELEITGYKNRIQYLEQRIQALENKLLAETKASKDSTNQRSSRDYVDYAYYPSAIISTDNHIVYVNAQFEKTFGYSNEEAQKSRAEMFIPELTLENRKSFNLEFKADKKNRLIGKQTDLLAHHKDGQTFPVDVGFSYISNETGYEILVTIIDISERKNAEKHLKTYIERLDLALSVGNIGVWDWNIKDNVLHWDDSMYKLYGQNKSEFTQAVDAWVACIHPEDREATESAIMDAVNDVKPFDREFRIKTASGNVKHIHGIANVIRDKNEEVIRMVGVSYDTTAEKEAYAKLLQSESQLKAFFDIAPIGIARNDMDGRFIEINPEFERFIGYTKEELNELSYWHLTPQDYQEQEEVQLKSLTETGKYGPYKKEYIHKDGHRFPVLLHGQILQSENGENYIWSTIQDLTQIESTQQKLMASLEELTTSNDELKRFAYVASHDLQEPIRVIMSYLQLLEISSKDLLDAKSLDYIKRSYTAAKRMRSLIIDLLSFSRVESKHIEPMPVDLADIIDVVLSDLTVTIKQHNVVVNVQENLPVVFGDPGQLQRVFLNIIGNGIKYQREGAQPVIDISCKETKHHFIISVKDNGIGIEQEYHDRIFEIFQRLHTSDEFSGTGIGLAIVKKIIKKHKGDIWFESELNKGTTFTFTLPVKPPSNG